MLEHVIAATFEGRGQASARIDGRTYVAQCLPGTITLAPRGHEGQWRVSGRVEVSNIYLGHDRLQAGADAIAEGRSFELLDRVNCPAPRLFAIMRLVCMEVESPGPHSLLYLEQVLDMLCIEILRSHSTLEARPVGARPALAQWQVGRVTAYMRENLGQDIALQDLADLVGMSRYHFCSAFKQATGIAPYECLTHIRMKMARGLLIHTSLQIGEIARAVGYGTTSAFSSSFQRLVGQSPREFRRCA